MTPSFFGSQDLEDREGRHVMVMVTDGGDTVSSKTYHQALESLHRPTLFSTPSW